MIRLRPLLFCASALLLTSTGCDSPPPPRPAQPQANSGADTAASTTPEEAPPETVQAAADATATTAIMGKHERLPKLKPGGKVQGKVDGTSAPMISRSYEDLVRDAEDTIEKARASTQKQPDSWTHWEALALAWMRHGRLTGGFDAYGEAQAALDKAFSVAKPNTGPFLTRAAFNLSMHRLNVVEPDVAMADRLVTLVGRSPMASTRAELELQRGEYAAARARLQKLLEDDARNFQARSRLALSHWKTGDFETADALFREALGNYYGKDALIHAWTHLQLGLLDLDRGRLAEAREHYTTAAKHVPGWWLIEEHLVELDVLEGRLEEARKAYEAIVDRTGNPEFMDALGELLAESEPEVSATWVAKARAAYEAQLERFPEAAYGHALEHFLTFAPKEPKTLELAKRNAELRPNGEALMLLAQAELGAEQPEAAKASIERAFATGYRSVDVHLTARDVALANNDAANAKAQCAFANTIAEGSCVSRE